MGINKQKYYKYVSDFFINNKCKLLTPFDKFTDKHEKNLSFKCKCGNIEKNISFKWYSRAINKLCSKCQKLNHKRRNEEFLKIKMFFEENGCLLLTKQKDYINQCSKNLSYKCSCDIIVENESYLLYYTSKYKCCESCKHIQMNHRYLSFEQVKDTFNNANVKLLTLKNDYKGIINTRFSYLCICNEVVNNISYNSFILSKYKRCEKCVKNNIKLKIKDIVNYKENILQKSIDTNIKKRGVKFPMQSREVQEKMKSNLIIHLSEKKVHSLVVDLKHRVLKD